MPFACNPPMSTFTQDVRYAFRTLTRNPGFVLVVVLTLGLGIGANTAIFSLMDQVLLRSLPVRDPGSLVLLDGPGPFQGRTMNAFTFSYPMYRDFRDLNQVFDGIIGRFPASMTVVWRGQAERANGELITGNYFDVLGVSAAAGRVFNAADDQTPGAHPVAVLSHGYWMRRFGGDAGVIGQTITVNGHPLTIVGVSAAGFSGLQVGQAADVMVPMMMKPQMTPTWNDLDNRRSRWINLVARLKRGVSREQAASGLQVIYRQINEAEIKDIA